MFMRKPALPALALVAALAGTAGLSTLPALAQTAAPQAQDQARDHREHHRDFSAARHIDGRIAYLKAELKITPQQEPQFNAFAEVMRNNARDEDAQMRQAGANQRPNAVDALKQAQQMAEMQSNGLKRLVPAFQALYDSLSDPQKKTADQVLGGGEEAGGPQGGAPAGKRR